MLPVVISVVNFMTKYLQSDLMEFNSLIENCYNFFVVVDLFALKDHNVIFQKQLLDIWRSWLNIYRVS